MHNTFEELRSKYANNPTVVWGYHNQTLEGITGYLYSLWSGQFIVKKVEITIHNPWGDREYSAFSRTKAGKGNQVSVMAGEFYNGTVWFEERNDAAASAILLAHSEESIWKLKEAIEKYEYKISLIKQGVIEK